VMQLLNNPTFVSNISDGHMKFDGTAIFKAFIDAAGWKFSQNFLVPMTPQEIQSYEANKPAALQQKQAQAQAAMSQQKFQQDQQLQDEEQLGKAGNEVIRTGLEHELASETTGEPEDTGGGFGSDQTL
jgi:hypothetical protein